MPLFPYTLHELLDDVEDDEELSAIISWLPDGKSFRLHNPILFEKRLLQKYFPRQSQLKSFMRQLQYYGFDNFGDGLFSHPRFLKGQQKLCGQIIHQLPTKNQLGTSTRPLKTRGRKKKNRGAGASTGVNGEEVTSSPNSATPPEPSSPQPRLQPEEQATTVATILDIDARKASQFNQALLRKRDEPSMSMKQKHFSDCNSYRPPGTAHNTAAATMMQRQQQQRFAISQQQLLETHARQNNIGFRDELLLGSMIHLAPRNISQLLGGGIGGNPNLPSQSMHQHFLANFLPSTRHYGNSFMNFAAPNQQSLVGIRTPIIGMPQIHHDSTTNMLASVPDVTSGTEKISQSHGGSPTTDERKQKGV